MEYLVVVFEEIAQYLQEKGDREPATIKAGGYDPITFSAVESVRVIYTADVGRYTAEDNTRKSDNIVLNDPHLSFTGVMARKIDFDNAITGSITGILFDRKFPNHLLGATAAYAAAAALKELSGNKSHGDYFREINSIMEAKELVSITVGYFNLNNLVITHLEPIIRNTDAFRVEIKLEKYSYSESRSVGVSLIDNGTDKNIQRDQKGSDGGHNFVKDPTNRQSELGGVLFNGLGL